MTIVVDVKRISLFLLFVTLSFILIACGGVSTQGNGTYTASGVVKDADGAPVASVVLHFSGGQGVSQTDAHGEWVKGGLRGEVTVTPVKEGYSFEPQSQRITPTFAREVSFLGAPTSVTVTPGSVTVEVDETQVFRAAGKDKYGQPVTMHPAWIVTGGIGVASPATGEEILFTATTPGEGTVVAEDGEVAGYAVVTVLPRQEAYDIEVTHSISSKPIEAVGGSVIAEVDDSSYDYGIVVTLTAAPDTGWHFLRWEGEVESDSEMISVVVIDREREPVDPFGVVGVPGGGYAIRWEWEGDPTYHPEIVAYGSETKGFTSRTTAGDMLEAKFASRQIRAVFEKDY